jgi:hypothetical protein
MGELRSAFLWQLAPDELDLLWGKRGPDRLVHRH